LWFYATYNIRKKYFFTNKSKRTFNQSMYQKKIKL
jgi:hypothetical protein